MGAPETGANFRLILDIQTVNYEFFAPGCYSRDELGLLSLRLVRIAMNNGCVVRTTIAEEEILIEPDENLALLTDKLDTLLNAEM